MPYINVCMSKKLERQDRNELARELGKIIPIIPGKTEAGFMVDIEDGKEIYNGGEHGNYVYMELKIYWTCDYEFRSAFTAAVFEIFSRRYGVEPHNMYLNITECDNWGIFGKLMVDPPPPPQGK